MTTEPALVEDAAERRSRRDVQVGLIRISILLVAAALRLVGATFGFPHLLHPDEFAVVDAVVVMAERNSFEPPWSYRPDHVEMKVDYGVFALFAWLKGTTIEAAFAEHQVQFYLLARLVTAAFGVATVLLAYLVGARWSRKAGLVAAALFAVFPPFVLHAHYATPDVPLTFAVMLLVLALSRYAVSTSWRSLLLACFAVALATGIKYPGAVGTLTIAAVVTVAAVRDRQWRRFVLHGIGSVVATAAFLFAISPTLFLEFSEVRAQIRVQAEGDRLGHPDHGFFGNLFFYVTEFLGPAGVVLSLLAVAGLVMVVRHRRLDTLPWFAGVPVWVSLSTLPMTWERWALPMWVTPLLLAAVGLTGLLDKLGRPRLRLISAAAVSLVAAHLVLGAVAADASLVARDTRLEARAWADDHGVTAEQSAYEGYTPFLMGAYQQFTDQVVDDGDGFTFLTQDDSPARYVVVSDFMYARTLADPENNVREVAIYRFVFENLHEIATFHGHDDDGSALEPLAIARHVTTLVDYGDGALTGPTIRIFEVPDS